MPTYDFRCGDCKWRGVLFFKSFAAYEEGEKHCPRCNSANMIRSIRRVAIARSENVRFSDMEDDSALDDLENADPATLGRYMRKMSEETGEDLGDEFKEVVNRLERGEDPESIEASLGEMGLGEGGDEGMAGGFGGGMGGGFGGDDLD